MLTLLMTGFALFVLWALWVYIVRPALEDFGVLQPLEEVSAPAPVLSTPADPEPIAIAPVSAPAPRSEAVPATLGTDAPEVREPLQLTKEDVVRALAELEIIGADGVAQPVSVKAIARFVGMRDADVSALVKEVRGDKSAPPKPAAPFEELTKDGRPIAAHLMRTKARA